MSTVNELYQELILDHNKRPRHYHEMVEATSRAEGYNPLCGDKVKIYVKERDGVLEEIAFQGNGCAISRASASMMTDALQGMSEAEARSLAERFRGMVTGESEPDLDEMGKLAVFAGVSEFPARVKCATLAWHTLQAALDRQTDAVTTEEGSEV